jgi:hypothetical protein
LSPGIVGRTWRRGNALEVMPVKAACKGGRGAGVSVLFRRCQQRVDRGSRTLPTPANGVEHRQSRCLQTFFCFFPASEPSRRRNAVGTRRACSVASTSTSPSALPVFRRLPKPRVRRSLAANVLHARNPFACRGRSRTKYNISHEVRLTPHVTTKRARARRIRHACSTGHSRSWRPLRGGGGD